MNAFCPRLKRLTGERNFKAKLQLKIVFCKTRFCIKRTDPIQLIEHQSQGSRGSSGSKPTKREMLKLKTA